MFERSTEAQKRDQIIAYFTGGKSPQVFITTDLAKATPEQTADFLKLLRSGKISRPEIASFLRDTPSSLDIEGADPEQIFAQIVKDPRETQILAVATGLNSDNWRSVSSKNLRAFLSQPKKNQPDYRTPVGFKGFRDRFLREIQPQAKPDQYRKYLKSMEHFQQTVYGPRYDYYLTLQKLQNSDSSPDNLDSPEPANTSTTSPDLTDRPTTATLTPLTPERRDQILNLSAIDGDPWCYAGQEYPLTIPSIVSAELSPIYEIILDQRPIFLSPTFPLTNNYAATLGYVSTPNGIKVRSFYREKTTGLWHYLPDYVRDLSGNGIEIFGKGYDERSTLLPLDLQAALCTLERSQSPLNITVTTPDFLFAGTAKAYNSKPEYNAALSSGQLRGDFYQEVSHTPYNSDAPLITQTRHKNAPQLLSVNADISPNFAAPLTQFSTYSSLATDISIYSYDSYDQQYNWLFCQDDRGRAWVGNIEILSPITSTACRRDWLGATDIETPLYERPRLADGYGNPNDIRSGYIGMWDNYLGRIPLIQQFLANHKS